MTAHLPHRDKEERPWGSFERFTANQSSTVKIITVTPNEAFSLQKHQHREEFWHVMRGSGTVTVGDVKTQAGVGDEFFVPAGTLHRVEAGTEGITLLEIAFGNFEESDVTRVEDRYGRA